MSDDVTMPSAKTLTVDKISSNTTFVDFSQKMYQLMDSFIQLKSNNGVIFEGSTADDFETNLRCYRSPADRTINFPNVTGTVVTTGDTGSITGTMIANDTIAEANMADDAIG